MDELIVLDVLVCLCFLVWDREHMYSDIELDCMTLIVMIVLCALYWCKFWSLFMHAFPKRTKSLHMEMSESYDLLLCIVLVTHFTMIYFIGDETILWTNHVIVCRYCKRMVKCKGWLTMKTSEYYTAETSVFILRWWTHTFTCMDVVNPTTVHILMFWLQVQQI